MTLPTKKIPMPKSPTSRKAIIGSPSQVIGTKDNITASPYTTDTRPSKPTMQKFPLPPSRTNLIKDGKRKSHSLFKNPILRIVIVLLILLIFIKGNFLENQYVDNLLPKPDQIIVGEDENVLFVGKNLSLQ
jgi:hypothetical protein